MIINLQGRKAHVRVIIHQEPCLLLEAMELAYSYVNKAPLEQLVASGEFAIPEKDVLHIRDTVCRALDPKDDMVRFFFQRIVVDRDPPASGRDLCIASHILYFNLTGFFPDIERQVQSFVDYWNSIPKPYIITEMDRHCLSIDSATSDQPVPLSRELAKLPVSPSVQNQFMDVIYNYEQYLRWLVKLLTPIAEELQPLLAPWVERDRPLLDRWDAFFHGANANDFFTKRLGLNGMECKTLEVALRYFPGNGGYVKALAPAGQACFLVGLSLSTLETDEKPGKEFTEKENASLRLLSSPDRVAMLQAMMHAPKGGQDLVRELGLHSGAVFRDLNNMARVGLINREVQEGRNIYRTNNAAVLRLSQRLVQVIGTEDS